MTSLNNFKMDGGRNVDEPVSYVTKLKLDLDPIEVFQMITHLYASLPHNSRAGYIVSTWCVEVSKIFCLAVMNKKLQLLLTLAAILKA